MDSCGRRRTSSSPGRGANKHTRCNPCGRRRTSSSPGRGAHKRTTLGAIHARRRRTSRPLVEGLAFFWSLHFPPVTVRSCSTIMGTVSNRTRLIRDASLATGKTCIACGSEATAKVGDYAVCGLHRVTVSAPDPLQHWKRNVRNRHARHWMRACSWCGRRRGLSRHHEWSAGERGKPPRPIVLCRRCHRLAEGRG